GLAAPAQSQETIVVSPATTPTPTPTPTPGGGGGGSGGGGGGTITPPSLVTNVTVSAVTESSAKVTVTLASPASVTLAYGLTTSYGADTLASPVLQTVFENLTNLTPGTIYDFRVIATPAG